MKRPPKKPRKLLPRTRKKPVNARGKSFGGMNQTAVLATKVLEVDWLNEIGITRPDQRRFLIAYEKLGSMAEACRVEHISPYTVVRWKQGKLSWSKNEPAPDPVEAEKFQLALRMAAEHRIHLLEVECRKRAFRGSDLLLMFLLKAARPHVYRDNYRRIEITGGEKDESSPEGILDVGVVPSRSKEVQLHVPEERMQEVVQMAERLGIKGLLVDKIVKVASEPVPAGGADAGR